MLNKDYYLLLSILETIGKVMEYTNPYNTAEEFYNNSKDFDASMMNFIVIGECVGKLSGDYKSSKPNIDWVKINGLSNIFNQSNYYSV